MDSNACSKDFNVVIHISIRGADPSRPVARQHPLVIVLWQRQTHTQKDPWSVKWIVLLNGILFFWIQRIFKERTAGRRKRAVCANEWFPVNANVKLMLQQSTTVWRRKKRRWTMSHSASKSAGAARMKISETGLAHGCAHAVMSIWKNELEMCSRQFFCDVCTEVRHAELSALKPKLSTLNALVQLTMTEAVRRLQKWKKQGKKRRETVNRCASISGGTARRRFSEKGVSKERSDSLSVKPWHAPLMCDPRNPSSTQKFAWQMVWKWHHQDSWDHMAKECTFLHWCPQWGQQTSKIFQFLVSLNRSHS